MLLLNVSDIHFKYPRCTTSQDADKPFRSLLVRDLREQRSKLGDVSAILVTGDIAAQGIKEEYEAAYEWLLKLAEESGCHKERIYVVPGNHDVNRGIAIGDPTIGNAQKVILGMAPHLKEKELEHQYSKENSSRALLSPIAAYNDFAANFDCQLWSPDRMYWMQTIPIDEHTDLRLHGLNSTLFSGIDGKNDEKNKLYLSPLQTVLDFEDDIVNAVLCHHPPDWCLDCDHIESAVKERASLHFFGHKHLQRFDTGSKYVRFSAGAVNPDRHEPLFEPGYNLVNLAIQQENGERFLVVEAHLRLYQSSPERFVARIGSDGSAVFPHRIPLPPVSTSRLKQTVAITTVQNSETIASFESVEVVMSQENTRNMVLRFWQLASSQRKEIMTGLGLIGSEELRLPEAERYGKAWKLAAEKGLIEKLAQEIEKREKTK
jgi:3',5'-cyclic AMP phosphodiesterase CpdA